MALRAVNAVNNVMNRLVTSNVSQSSKLLSSTTLDQNRLSAVSAATTYQLDAIQHSNQDSKVLSTAKKVTAPKKRAPALRVPAPKAKGSLPLSGEKAPIRREKAGKLYEREGADFDSRAPQAGVEKSSSGIFSRNAGQKDSLLGQDPAETDRDQKGTGSRRSTGLLVDVRI